MCGGFSEVEEGEGRLGGGSIDGEHGSCASMPILVFSRLGQKGSSLPLVLFKSRNRFVPITHFRKSYLLQSVWMDKGKGIEEE